MGTENEDMVPRARLNEKNDRIKALEAELASSTMKLKDAESAAAGINKWKAKYEAEREAHATTRAGYDERLTLMGAGVGDEADQHLVRWKYSQLPEEGRPTLAEYLKGAALEDKHLGPMLRPAGAGDAETGEQPAEPKRAPEVRDTNGVRKPPSTAPDNEVAKIMSMSDEDYSAARGGLFGG